ncbi:hypothetical protein SAMN05216227_103031 [Pseudorhodobacter antarcticus]|uniref:Uncharacterized protein n=1 Tax=Pseudorhodobacter antarcticus TaxID=1077947 RepID=A0A1H8KA67_9RHOB|nr:hypothetical protein SAMN05216227_103031 [Pseudorhodobacter antarcticus]
MGNLFEALLCELMHESALFGLFITVIDGELARWPWNAQPFAWHSMRSFERRAKGADPPISL